MKFNDSSYVKTLKLEILTLLVCPENIEPIVVEMREAVTDISTEISKHAIQCLGQIALTMDEFAVHIIKNLLELLRYYSGAGADDDAVGASDDKKAFITDEGGTVTTEIVVVLKDLFRKYPDLFQSEISENLFSKVMTAVFAVKNDTFMASGAGGGGGGSKSSMSANLLNATASSSFAPGSTKRAANKR